MSSRPGPTSCARVRSALPRASRSTRTARRATSAAAALLGGLVVASCAAPPAAARASSAPTAVAGQPARGSTSAAPEGRTPRPALTPGAVDRSAELFFRSGCFACHGARAEGYVGPRLARTTLSLEAVLLQVRHPDDSRMTPFSRERLSDDGVAAIYAFLQSLGAP